MTIKDFKCKCGHNDFFFADKGNQKGIYCSYCGKWVKWADKNEQNLAMKQKPILDKIRAEIIMYEGDCRLSVDEYPSCKQCSDNVFETIYGILDKYKAESEDEE